MSISTIAFPAPFPALLRAAALGLALFLLTPARAQAQTWMVSTDAYVRLGVMDKFGALGAYSAKFVVTNNTTGKSYSLVREVGNGQNGIDVIFPSAPSEADYFKSETGEAGQGLPGTYVWECQVAGKRVVSGRFTFPEAGNDVTTIVVDQKK